MEATAAEKYANRSGPQPDNIIHVVGQRSLNNELLADFIGSELQTGCRLSTNGSLADALRKFPDKTHLAFRDCNGNDKSGFFELPDLKEAYQHPRCRLILYNVDPAGGIEIDALKKGIRGILYTDHPLEFFPKAALAVLTGQLWYCRLFLSQFILKQENHAVVPDEAFYVLTRREKQIIQKVSQGFSNKDIARAFNISTNTVKTHIYKIFRKLKVVNRMQATLWVEKQL
jgi:DNA-binding NarL/FixJ family response regulator